MIRIFEEMTLKLAVVVCLADPRAEDENRSRREDHVIKVHRGLGCKVAESPLPGAPAVDVLPPIACHGGPWGNLFGLQHMRNSMVNARDSRFILVWTLDL